MKKKIFRIAGIFILIVCIVIGSYLFYTRHRKQNLKLYNAIEINDLEAAKEAIDDGADKDSFRCITLTMESRYGRIDRNPAYADTVMRNNNQIARYLIDQGADLNYKDKDGISLLMIAAQDGNLTFCKQLIEKGADVTYKKKGMSALDYAISSNQMADSKAQIKLLDYLYQKKVPVTIYTKRILEKGYMPGTYGMTTINGERVLQWGIDHGIITQKDIPAKRQIFYKISQGEKASALNLNDQNIKKLSNVYGENIAMAAARYGNLDVLKYAVEKKASLKEKNLDEDGLINIAANSGDIPTMKYVIEIMKPSQDQICQCMEDMINSISGEMLSYLSKQLTDINQSPSDHDENILESAVTSGRTDIVRILLKNGATVTPMALNNAVDTRDIQLMDLLLENGGEINKIGKYNKKEKMNSVLFEAVSIGDFKMVKYLVEHGAKNIDIKEAIEDSNSDRIKGYLRKQFKNL